MKKNKKKKKNHSIAEILNKIGMAFLLFAILLILINTRTLDSRAHIVALFLFLSFSFRLPLSWIDLNKPPAGNRYDEYSKSYSFQWFVGGLVGAIGSLWAMIFLMTRN